MSLHKQLLLHKVFRHGIVVNRKYKPPNDVLSCPLLTQNVWLILNLTNGYV